MRLVSDRPLIFGVLNVTPDSFSDGGRFLDAGAAIAMARALRSDGADVIDIGGESTRPGAERVSPQLELDRVMPVIEALVPLGMQLSIDTMRASTARAAIAAGVQIVNDVSGGLADPEMAATVADSDARFVAMHWRGHSREMDALTDYRDVVTEVRDELAGRVAALEAAGISRERLVLDPGLGFAKTAEQSWQLLANTQVLAELGLPLLVGASRKRLLAGVLAADAPVRERDLPTDRKSVV